MENIFTTDSITEAASITDNTTSKKLLWGIPEVAEVDCSLTALGIDVLSVGDLYGYS